MVIQNANGQDCCEGRCCCPALVTPSLFLYPDDEQERVVVEDVPDDEDEDLQEPMFLLTNQTPPDGEWMEPIPTKSATTSAVPTIKENSCSVQGTTVLQQYSLKRTNKNRNRKRIRKMIRYTEQCSDLSNEQRERELERLQYELEIFQRGKQYFGLNEGNAVQLF